jgi:release factor glutamine methyltransferase
VKSFAELLLFGAGELQKAGVVEYHLDSRLLLQACTGKSRTEILLDGDAAVNGTLLNIYLQYLERRKKREPVAYILGEQEFWSLPFYVTPEVLIPRPETELLLDRVFALGDPENFSRGNILDLCCGSGVIASVLAKETSRKVCGLDISFQALEVARRNNLRHDVEPLVDLIQGDLFSPFSEDRCFSLIVSNPPYVSSTDVSHNLEPEVALFEPHLALDGGDKGLEIIREIHDGLSGMLSSGGQIFMEIGADQGEVVKNLFQENLYGRSCFEQVEILKDYSGRDRVLYARMAN